MLLRWNVPCTYDNLTRTVRIKTGNLRKCIDKETLFPFNRAGVEDVLLQILVGFQTEIFHLGNLLHQITWGEVRK